MYICEHFNQMHVFLFLVTVKLVNKNEICYNYVQKDDR